MSATTDRTKPNAAMEILLIALGGAIGCLTRFGVEHIGWFDDDKYYYTVFINITGCMLIGALWALFGHFGVHRLWYLFVFTGCLGGYTTYSAFTLDAMLLLQNHLYLRALFYVGATFVGGLGGCAIGLFGMEKLLKTI